MILDFIFINKILIILINLIGLWLAFWVYSSGKKEKVNRGFLLLVIPNLLWINFYNLACWSAQHHLSLLYIRLTFAFVFIFFLSAYYLFIVWFLRKKGWYLLIGKILSAYAFIFSIFCIFTNFIILNIKSEEWGVIPIFSYEGKFIFYSLVIFLTLLINGNFIIEYFKFSEKIKLKIQYFLIGVVIFAGINFIFGVISPFFLGIYKYYHLANYSTIILFGFTAYAIVKHKLFDVKIILTSTLVGLITILLLLDTLLFTENFSIEVLKGASLLLFLFFGFYLIKSVKEEVKRREDAEILSRAKSEFISMASHQLRTPLTVIKGYVSMILDGSYGKIEPKAKKVLGNVSVSTERLIKIIEDLLNISRIELGKMDLEKKPTDIKKMIDNVCQEIKIKAKEKNLKLIWEKPKSELPKLNIDKLKIRQVIYNIVDNAIKYTETGKVEIKLSRENSNLIINISDTGIGFNEKDRIKLFELFSRGEAGTDTFVEGTGMGLYVAKKFVNLHKGKIWADSKGKNKGSVFHIELPIK